MPKYDYHVTEEEFNWYLAQGGAGTFFLKSARRSKDMVGATSDRVRATRTGARGPVGHQVAKLRFLEKGVSMLSACPRQGAGLAGGALGSSLSNWMDLVDYSG